MTTITVHSFKGGTGKSLIAVALAYSMSREGKKVLLIDGDYFAPCLETYFPPKGRPRPFTSFLEGECNLEKTVSKTGFTNLYVSYAPPPTFSEEILRADVGTHGRYLKRILEATELAHNELGFDNIIIDNSSGISLPSINQLSCSNKSVIVIRPVRYGVESTYQLSRAIYKKLRYADSKSVRQDYLVWNQVPTLEDLSFDSKIEAYLRQWTQKFDEADIVHGTTIPYMSKVVTAMIGETTLDLPKIAKSISNYIEELKQKMV
jgi:MinD-like ATPase involved in chromosome partitioning or flagellar assembly